MKKLFLCLAAMVIAAGLLCGCSTKNIEGSLEEIMAQIYEGADGKPFTIEKSITPDMDPQNFEYYFGTSNIKFKEALASDAAISPGVHSVVLIRVADDENISALKDRIKDSNVGMKWVCAGVPKDDVIVDSVGDLVVIIIERNPQPLYDNFKKLAK